MTLRPTRSAPPTSIARLLSRGSTPARALAFVVALLVLLVSLSAEAKKKKPAAKKHKTPAAKTKGKGKEALPAEPAGESDEASSDEKPDAEDEDKAKKPTPAPEPEEDAPKPPPKAAKAPPPKESDSEAGGGLVAFRFGIGGRALFRTVDWTGDMGMLAPYSLKPGPQLGLWLEAFPAAFATDGFAGNIGVFGHFNLGLGASSKDPAGTVLTTKYQDFLAGLKVRVPFGGFQPYVAVGYGAQKFSLETAAPTRPNFSYGLVFIGAGARIQVTDAFDVDLAGGYLNVLGTGTGAGEFKQLYPRATAVGFDASLSAGFRVASMIGIRAGLDFRQYGLATSFRTGDTGIPAVGGVDRNITVWGGLELVFDGVGGGGAGSDEAAPAKKPPAKAKKPAKEAEPDEESDKEE